VKIFIIIWTLWFVSEIILNRLFRSGAADKKLDKGSLNILWVVILVSILCAVASQYICFVPLMHTMVMRYVGVTMIVLGIIGKVIAVKSLGKFFTVDVSIREHHTLKQDGIYNYLRHPIYSFTIVSFVGFGLSLGSWVSLVIAVIPVTVALLYRIQIEEKVLLAQFGMQYSEYMKTTYRLVPFIY
jgi:protein-S-isoprenylcysteine O-methyltransferase Ste14